ncbi:MAG TPA: alkaline phosphatase family protein [Acidimicrobiia bacterium]|nr:alkaline phosphatase family protein [Acidimicrobiia bacterium]
MIPDVGDAVLPALGGACVTGILPALFGRADDSWLPAPARGGGRAVLLVLDGLGANAVIEHAAIMPNLAAMDGDAITTVTPSTTATALTSITTGLAPAQHGLVGYRMRVDRDVLNVLRWTVPDRRNLPDPLDVQRHEPFLGREPPVVTRSEFRSTGFTKAHLRGGRFVGWQTDAILVEQCVRCIERGDNFVYAYYPGIDTVAHEFGLRERAYARELASADRLVGDLRAALPGDVALLVTSDHGQVHLEAESWLAIDGVDRDVAAMAGDGRFRYLYARPQRAKALYEHAQAAVGDHAWVWTRSELLDAGLLGTGATGTIPGRIGDVVLIARGPVAFIDPALAHEAHLRSGHGALSADEMLVPLRASRG